MRALLKEMRSIMTAPPEGIRVQFHEDNVTNIIADIDGPADTPFQDGVFRCKLVLGAEYPAAPPKGEREGHCSKRPPLPCPAPSCLSSARSR